MALVASIDGPNRRIYLGVGSVGVDLYPIDLYREVRTLRRTDESLRSFDAFLEARGHEVKNALAGKYTERFVRLLSGTRIVPYDTSQVLSVKGTLLTDDGQEGPACFDRSMTSVGVEIDINYEPPQVEIIEVSSGSGLSTAEHDQLMALANGLTASQAIQLSAILKAHMNRRARDSGTGVITLYDDDGTTPYKQFDSNSDLSEITPI